MNMKRKVIFLYKTGILFSDYTQNIGKEKRLCWHISPDTKRENKHAYTR